MSGAEEDAFIARVVRLIAADNGNTDHQVAHNILAAAYVAANVSKADPRAREAAEKIASWYFEQHGVNLVLGLDAMTSLIDESYRPPT